MTSLLACIPPLALIIQLPGSIPADSGRDGLQAGDDYRRCALLRRKARSSTVAVRQFAIDREAPRTVGVEIEQRAHDRDVLEQRPGMARGEMDGDRYGDQRDEDKQGRDARQKPQRKGDPETHENRAAEPEQPRRIADHGDRITPRRFCHPREHSVMGGEVADPADDEDQAGGDAEDRVEPGAELFAGRQPCVDLR